MASAGPSPFEKRDLLLIITIALLSGIFKELMAYLFIYRRSSYKKNFAKLSEKYEKYHLTQVIFDPATGDGDSTAAASRELLDAIKAVKKVNNIYTIASGLLFMILMLLVMSYFEGCVVAKLPFTPVYPIYLFTQGDTAGGDRTNCSASCIYTMLSMSVKDAVQTVLGYRSAIAPFMENTLNNSLDKDKEK